MTKLKMSVKAFLLASLLGVCCGLDQGHKIRAQEKGSPTETFLQVLAGAEAKSNAKEWSEAAALWEKVVQQNPTEGGFWSQLGQARFNAQDYRGVIPAFEKVIALGWGLPPERAYDIARCYALLGDKESALEWLDKAFQMGFRRIDNASKAAEFQSLHTDERFRKIVALIDTNGMSRDEGWRYDLALLGREIKRVGYAPLLRQNEIEINVAVQRLHDSIPKLTDMQIIVEMMKLLRKVGDGHTGLYPYTRPEFQQALPVQFYLFKEGLFIIAADPKHKDLLGAEVLRIQDQSIDKMISALDSLISRDNENAIWTRQRAPYMMRHLPLLKALGLISGHEEVPLTIRGLDGQTRTVNLLADTSQPNIWNIRPHPATWISLPQTLTAPIPLYLKNMAPPYWFEHLPQSKLVYAQFNSIRNDPNESFAQFSNRLLKFVNETDVEGLVIDLRWNNGGNTALAPSLIHGLLRSEKINRRGRLFVIVGRRTFSAAQNTATFIERHTNAIFVGEPTGSSPNFIGEEEFFTLPHSRLQANVSELYWQSSWPGDRRTWIAPMIYAPPTFEAYRMNRDPALEAIMAYRNHSRRTENTPAL